jgi:hypothetical protein
VSAATWGRNPTITPETFEIVKITAASGNTLTVTRAQESTTAKAFLTGDIITLDVTAGVFGELKTILTDGSPLYVDADNDRVGIGNTTPDFELHGEKDGSIIWAMSRASTDASGPAFRFYKSRGTHASPTAIASGDPTMAFHGLAYHASGTPGFVINSALSGACDGAESGDTVPGRLSFFTMVSGGSLTERMRIDSAGNAAIGTTTMTLGQLAVAQASTTAAEPPLWLQQADIDQDMMEFDTTIGTGNAIEAIGAKVLTTTHFVKVTIPGALTRYFPVGTIA